MNELPCGVSEKNNLPQRPKKRPFVESMKNKEIVWLERISNTVNTAEEQVPLIVKEIEAESAYYQSVVLLCKDLQNALKFFFKEQNIKVLPFGSAVTNLALRDSDVDLFLDFDGELPQPANEFTKRLRNIMYKTKIVKKACAILARVPIVKCEANIGINCDISFSNQLGVINSRLINFLLQSDKRTRPLILILKFLFKKRGLIAKNGLTSYALIILVVFFLQQVKVIPSIKELQDLSTAKDIVAGWDSSFSTQITKCDPEQCDYSVLELLRRFFKFYAEFEFAFYMISPFTAKAYLKPIFAESQYTPPEFCCYRENLKNETHAPFELNKFVCVQDPFNHSNNVTRTITQEKLFELQSICEKSLGLWQEELQNNNNSDKKGSKSNLFKKLFTQNMAIDEKKKMLKQRTISIFAYKFMVNKYLDQCSEDMLRNNWTRTMTQNLIDILTRILMCKVNEVPKEKYEENSKALKNLNVVALLQCEFEHFYLLTKLRRQMKQKLKLPGTLPLRDREAVISKSLCEIGGKHDGQEPLKFEAICFVKKGPTCFCINIENQQETGVHKGVSGELFQFLKFNLAKLISS